jgi:hypothetical protein
MRRLFAYRRVLFGDANHGRRHVDPARLIALFDKPSKPLASTATEVHHFVAGGKTMFIKPL